MGSKLKETPINILDLEKHLKESQINFLSVMISLYKYLKSDDHQQVMQHLNLLIENKDFLKIEPEDTASISEKGVLEIKDLLTRLKKPFGETSEILSEIFILMEYLSNGIDEIKKKKGIK